MEKPKGYAFSFKAEIQEKKLQVAEFKGNHIDDDARTLIEGEYALEK